MKIVSLETTLYRIPLPTPVEAASHGVMREFDMVSVRVRDSGRAECGIPRSPRVRFGGFMAQPLQLRDGMAIAPDRPGHGIEFDWVALDAYRVGSA